MTTVGTCATHLWSTALRHAIIKNCGRSSVLFLQRKASGGCRSCALVGGDAGQMASPLIPYSSLQKGTVLPVAMKTSTTWFDYYNTSKRCVRYYPSIQHNAQHHQHKAECTRSPHHSSSKKQNTHTFSFCLCRIDSTVVPNSQILPTLSQ